MRHGRQLEGWYGTVDGPLPTARRWCGPLVGQRMARCRPRAAGAGRCRAEDGPLLAPRQPVIRLSARRRSRPRRPWRSRATLTVAGVAQFGGSSTARPAAWPATCPAVRARLDRLGAVAGPIGRPGPPRRSRRAETSLLVGGQWSPVAGRLVAWSPGRLAAWPPGRWLTSNDPGRGARLTAVAVVLGAWARLSPGGWPPRTFRESESRPHMGYALCRLRGSDGDCRPERKHLRGQFPGRDARRPPACPHPRPGRRGKPRRRRTWWTRRRTRRRDVARGSTERGRPTAGATTPARRARPRSPPG
jgi:hypothetical protein